eukprot:6498683-Ditylum_brightwellii.AAC.1
MGLKKGQGVNRGRIKRFARACGVSKPLSVNTTTACRHCAEAKAIYLSSKPDAEEIRLSFLSDNNDIPIRKQGS